VISIWRSALVKAGHITDEAKKIQDEHNKLVCRVCILEEHNRIRYEGRIKDKP
jgi:hypothetical protein